MAKECDAVIEEFVEVFNASDYVRELLAFSPAVAAYIETVLSLLTRPLGTTSQNFDIKMP